MKIHTPKLAPGKKPLARRRAAERGLVLWLTLVAMLLFAALAMYVADIGHHVEKQEATQDAADAAAIGAAGEVARTFNLIAHDNTEMARLITAAQMLDSMPQATAYTLADQQAMLASLQALGPVPNAVPTGAPPGTPSVSQVLTNTIGDVQAQVTALTPVVNGYYNNYGTCAPGKLQNLAFGGNDIRTSTWYAPPSGGDKGALWKGVSALDKLSQAAMNQLPETAARGASASGIKVQGDGAQALSAAVPFRITVPCQRGAFDDFFNPIMNGRIPDAAGGTDTLLHRGPYDSIYGWVSMPKIWIPNPGPQQPGPPAAPSAGGFSGNTPAGPANGHWIYDPSRYWTQGVFVHENNFFDATVGGPLWLGGGVAGSLPTNIGVNTQLNGRVGQFSIHKLMMAQNGGAPWSNAVPADRLPPLFVPNWLFPMATAQAAAQAAGNDPSAPINKPDAYASWVRVAFPSPSLPAANWELTRISQGQRHFPSRIPGTPPVDQFFEVPQTAYSVKLAEGVYVVFTPPVVDPQTGATTSPASNPVIYLWAGVNLQTVKLADDPTNQLTPDDKTAYIQNPNNWAAGASDIPAPIDFTSEYASPPANPMTPSQLVPGQWCVLGIAAQPNKAVAWSAKFHSDNYQRQTALAQAWVFNNHSWDLWTPMWHAQLCPISQYDTWLSTMQSTQGQAGNGDGVNMSELPGFIKQMQAIQPMETLITH